jgi:transketolase
MRPKRLVAEHYELGIHKNAPGSLTPYPFASNFPRQQAFGCEGNQDTDLTRDPIDSAHPSQHHPKQPIAGLHRRLSKIGYSMTATHQEMANAIRALAMDAVQKAKSGHPGMPMGFADVATVLFTKIMKFDPADHHWADRDRFILSAGHGSMLVYSLLHLLGYENMTIQEIKDFRQLGASTAGHPEYGHVAGVEMTTGPLGQGLATSVGFALGERLLEAEFGADLVDHFTYVAVGDGCLMEGISHEAIALAGHLKLSKLIVLFDDNGITIDGPLSLSDSTDQIGRFAAAGWDVARIDGHDPEAIERAILAAQKTDQPSFIACKTTIGYGSPNKQGTSATHGAPLGEDEIAATRATLGWTSEPFEIPQNVMDAWRSAGTRSKGARSQWHGRLEAASSSVKAEFTRRLAGELPENFDDAINTYKKQLSTDTPKIATRSASEKVLGVINTVLNETIGGSADLTGSNNTKTDNLDIVSRDSLKGRYIYYGIREFGMAAAMNGLALHGGFIPYGGTFLVFSDYSRPAIRLGALMNQRVIHVMTHDSIGLGEDGPTHQPVEHLAALRAMPNLLVFRPADAVETAECWQAALESDHRPSLLALTRQGLPTVRKEHTEENLTANGAYELKAASSDAKVSLFATGSEVEIALAAQSLLEAEGIPARVVSVPCFELFFEQEEEYRSRIIGDASAKVAVEAAVSMGWDAIIGQTGRFVGMSGFGASAPIKDLYNHFGITAEAVAEAAKAQL